MRKLLTTLIFTTILLLHLPAETSVDIAPYAGAFGVPLASSKYYYGDLTVPANLNKITWKDGNTLDSIDETYQNSQMIALLGAYRIPFPANTEDPNEIISDLKNYTLHVEATCAGGFYFTSQSNPAFKRPFQILFITKEQLTNSSTNTNGAEKQLEVKLVGEGTGATTSFEFGFNGTSWGTDAFKNVDAARLKCDVVLVLPYDKNSSNVDKPIDTYNDRITWQGVSYPLSEGNDYIAQVQFTVNLIHKTDSSKNLSYSISVPFSGYYNKTTDLDTLLSNSICNMYVTTSSEAARIDLASAMTNGNEIHVGDINMWMGLTNIQKSNTSPSGYEIKENDVTREYIPDVEGPKIFASASRDPNAASKQLGSGFLLVHDSVKNNTLLSDTNSVGYTVRFTNTEKNGYVDFKGNIGYEDLLKTSSLITSNLEEVPHNPPGGGQSTNYYYYHYNGSISIKLDQRDNPIMYPGRYTGNIYIHLVSGT